jgi:hypothetical protein
MKGSRPSITARAARLLLAALIIWMCFYPNSAVAYTLHLDRLELLSSGNLGRPQTFCFALLPLVAWLLYVRSTSSIYSVRFLWWAVGIYIVALVVSPLCQFGYDSANATCTVVASALGLGLLFSFLCGSPRAALMLSSVAAICLALSAVCDYAIKLNVMASGSLWRAGGPMNQPLELSNTLLPFPMFLVFFSTEGRNAIQGTSWLIGAGTTLSALILAACRGPIAAVAAALTFMCINVKRLSAFIAVIVVFAAACSAMNFVRTDGAVNYFSTLRSNAGRIVVWEAGWKVFEKHWISGVGPGELDMPIHATLLGRHLDEAASQSSNLLLQWLDELGGGGGMLLILIACCITSILRRSESPLSRPLAAAWLGIAFAGIFDVPFGTNVEIAPTFVVGLLLGVTMMVGCDMRRDCLVARNLASTNLERTTVER